jgi:hypothetical protein
MQETAQTMGEKVVENLVDEGIEKALRSKIDKVKERFENSSQDVKELVEAVGVLVENRVRQAKEAVKEAAQQVKEALTAANCCVQPAT